MGLILFVALLVDVFAVATRWPTLRWRHPWEFAPTLNVLGCVVYLTIIPPSRQDFWAPMLYHLTGIPNLEDFIANTAYLIGATALLHNIFRRLKMPNKQRFMGLRVGVFVTIFFPLHTSVFVWAANVIDSGNITLSFVCYCLVESFGSGWLLVHMIWGLLIIRRDPRSREVVNLYLIAILLGCAAGLSKFATVVFPAWPSWIGWAGVAGATIGYGVASISSWRQRIPSSDPRHSGPIPIRR